MDDFLAIRGGCPAPDWATQSKGWKFCQRVFAIEAAKIPFTQQAMNNEMMMMLLKRGVM